MHSVGHQRRLPLATVNLHAH